MVLAWIIKNKKIREYFVAINLFKLGTESREPTVLKWGNSRVLCHASTWYDDFVQSSTPGCDDVIASKTSVVVILTRFGLYR